MMERRSIRLCTIGCLSVTHKSSATAAINLNRGHTIFKPLYIALKLEFIEVYCDLKLQGYPEIRSHRPRLFQRMSDSDVLLDVYIGSTTCHVFMNPKLL